MESNIIQFMSNKDNWETFLEYKLNNNHLDNGEQASLRSYIDNQTFLRMVSSISDKRFPNELATMKYVNKSGTDKKREVYVFSGDVSITLKFIAFYLYKYDKFFSKNCYAFRNHYGVKNAFSRINQLNSARFCSKVHKQKLSNMYGYKVDIQNYFNSIDIEMLLHRLSFIEDEYLLSVFENMLLEKKVIINGNIVEKEHGAMAGIPVAPFFANVFLMELDFYFEQMEIPYFRYSDDILIFAEDEKLLESYIEIIHDFLKSHHLDVNPKKEKKYGPMDKWEFLGFSFCDGVIDLSENTKNKIKAKIRHKAKALMRWQRKKNLQPRMAAKGFINAMNRKFFDDANEDAFTWSRWFFPILNTNQGLKEIDHYMQQYIRYIFTGRHYKGNYRITYGDMKALGYRSLVNEFYQPIKPEV